MSSKLLACLGCAILLSLPFLAPFFFPLAWIAFVPLFWVVRHAGTGRVFFLGWLAGILAHLLGFYWLNYTIRVFGGFSYGLSAIIFLLFALYSALPVALFSVLIRQYGFGPLNLFPAVLWVTLEFFFPGLFPWHLADSQSQFLLFVQSGDLAGPFGVSFLLMWTNAALYAVIFSGTKKANAIRELVILGTVLLAALFYGHSRLKAIPISMEKAPTLSVAAVQGGIDIKRKWNIAYMESNLRAYQELTKSSQGAELVVWPEAAVEAWLPEDIRKLPPSLLPPLKPNTFLIFGARSFRGDPKGPDLKVFNSAFLADFEGRILGHYHKQVLLAFGEYIPFAAFLSGLPGIPSPIDGFTPGEGPSILEPRAGLRAAPLICYEDIMPGLSRRFVAEKGANLLINLTNDAWFGDTVAPWQHARLAQWRAIETRRYLVRVTNTGVTSVIDPSGKILQTLPTFSAGVLTAKVKLLEGETFYARFGDWFAWLATAVSLMIVAHRFAAKTKTAG